MRLILFGLLIIVTSTVSAQSYENLSSEEKAYVDSMVMRKNMIQQSQPHNLMVSFSEGTVDELKPFFVYLINHGYRTVHGREVDVTAIPTGYVAKFHKIDEYSQKDLPLTLTVTCVKNTRDLQSAVITGNFNLLVSLYLEYFGGHARPEGPEKGGLAKTYNLTDEIRLYNNRITIAAHHNSFSGN